jgi:poly-gamma-glutamate capsule biosynthesis protein CapA/YwtB (metallophosphatase superfamily)
MFSLAATAVLSAATLFPTGFQSAILAAVMGPLDIQQPHTTILFGGDMLFDRSIRTAIDAKGGDFIFSCIDPLLSREDLVVANLEGPITGSASRSVGSVTGSSNNFIFTFAPSTAALLLAHNIHIVNIGNNHILNFGWMGLASTTQILADAGVGYFGDPLHSTVASGQFNHVPLSFINYNQFAPGSSIKTAAQTIKNIKAAREAGAIPIVYTHWGSEYIPATVDEKTLAHAFIDAGAEMVIGSHPHVVQESEVYKGKYIYYSLGNFIFDQYFSDAVRHGLMLEVTFTQDGVASVKEIPIELERDRRTCPVDPALINP